MNRLKEKKFKYYSLILLAAIGAGFLSVQICSAQEDKRKHPKTPDNETIKVMPFVNDVSHCYECHSPEEIDGNKNFEALTHTCDTICLKCHRERMKAHHKTGMPMTGKVPNPLHLSREKKLMCFSCHELTLARYSKESRKAQSLFGRIFSNKKIYKTYYLAINNRKGALCKVCH